MIDLTNLDLEVNYCEYVYQRKRMVGGGHFSTSKFVPICKYFQDPDIFPVPDNSN